MTTRTLQSRPDTIPATLLLASLVLLSTTATSFAQDRVNTTTTCLGDVCYTTGTVGGQRVNTTTTRLGDIEYTKDLLREIAKLKLWGLATQFSFDCLHDDEYIDLLADAGGVMAFIGLESLNEPSLLSVHKKHNRVEEYKDLFRKLLLVKLVEFGALPGKARPLHTDDLFVNRLLNGDAPVGIYLSLHKLIDLLEKAFLNGNGDLVLGHGMIIYHTPVWIKRIAGRREEARRRSQTKTKLNS